MKILIKSEIYFGNWKNNKKAANGIYIWINELKFIRIMKNKILMFKTVILMKKDILEVYIY